MVLNGQCEMLTKLAVEDFLLLKTGMALLAIRLNDLDNIVLFC